MVPKLQTKSNVKQRTLCVFITVIAKYVNNAMERSRI
jgi:hypothetical protein